MGKLIKGVLIVILAVILLIVVAVVALILLAGYKESHYYKFAVPGGEIEKKYTALGSHDVSSVEYSAGNDVWKKYEIWYPTEMKDSGKTYPLVIMANGTGYTVQKYKEVLDHLASWGFIVAGNEDENSRTGESTAATLDYMLMLNKDPSSPFYGKIDTDHIGVGGHSQGGVGAMNAVTEQENGNLYKAIWAASTTSMYHAKGLNESGGGWDCYPAKINIPILMVAGTGFMDAGNLDHYTETLAEGEAQGICPLWWLEECYEEVSDNIPKVMARLVGKDHGDLARYADGYMTAWFMYWLCGDEEAGNAFFGDGAELLSNENWQDVKVSQ